MVLEGIFTYPSPGPDLQAAGFHVRKEARLRCKWLSYELRQEPAWGGGLFFVSPRSWRFPADHPDFVLWEAHL